MRLLVFNLATDADDPALGFTTAWLNALAQRCDAIDVITMRAGRLAVAANIRVFSIGKEQGYSEARRARVFYDTLLRLLRQHRCDAAFAHMTPLFAIMAAPLLRPHGIPLTLWYAHKAVTRQLRWAERLSQRVVSASPESFRLPSAKLRIIGHGIDTALFAPSENPLNGSLFTILTAGRVTPSKGIETLLEAARVLYHDLGWKTLRVRIIGGSSSAVGDTDYGQKLKQEARALGLAGVVEFAGAVSYDRMTAEYQAADVMVNLSATGSLDKAVLEAMACGLPVITANEAFFSLLAPWEERLLIPPGQPGRLAAALLRLKHDDPAARRALGLALRALVVEQHSLDRLADTLIALFREDADR
jgi:glycosyltransferase involved in cell wall biosynthesis